LYADDPVFQKFLAMATDKGFFKGAEKGTPAYDAKYASIVQKYKERTAAAAAAAASASGSAASAGSGSASTPNSSGPAASAADEAAAEAAKNTGNSHLAAGRISEAIASYTEAIRLAPRGKNVRFSVQKIAFS
jgi:hypothetical protein